MAEGVLYWVSAEQGVGIGSWVPKLCGGALTISTTLRPAYRVLGRADTRVGGSQFGSTIPSG